MLHLDFESAGELDITQCGTWRYWEHPSTFILMLSWAFNDEPVQLWQPHLGPMPDKLLQGLLDEFCPLVSWYSAFERLGLWFKLGIKTSISRWIDPLILARHMSLPGKLDKVGEILDIEAKKIKEFYVKDQHMVDFFCTPLRMGGEITLFGVEPTTYRDWSTHPKEWDIFCRYCIRDTEAEREILHRFSQFPLPDWEYELWEVSEEANDRGVYIDSVLLQGATLIVEKEQAALKKEFIELTKVQNPRSNPQVLAWARSHGYTFTSIGKPYIKRALNGESDLDEEAVKGLNLRLQLSKSSVSKLESCKNSLASDGRVHHLFSFMGAARSGRYSSGLFQAHNLIKATKEVDAQLDLALSMLKAADYEGIKATFSSPLDVACSALRPMLVPKPGCKFAIADYSAIESRGAGWVTGCKKLNEDFKNGLDPYIAFAAVLDGVRSYQEMLYEYKVLKDKTNRTNSKPAVLGAIYELGPGEITYDEEGNTVKTGLLGYAAALGVELTPEFAIKAIEVFRRVHPEVVDFWYDLHRAFVNACENDHIVELGPLVIEKKGRVLCVKLPSGRSLHYINPRIVWEEATSKKGNKYQRSVIFVEGIDAKTHQWCEINTRGGKLFENVIQGICRDILGCGLINAAKAGYEIVLHVHDELVAEIPENGDLSVEGLIECMTRYIPWAPDMLITAEGYLADYYFKE